MKATLSRRTFLAGSAVAAAAAGLTLAGCGGGGETTDTPSTDAGTDAGAAAQGGTLTGAMAYTSTNVNPIGNSSALMLAATWHVFEGLYDLDLHTYKTYNALAAGEPTKVSDTEYEVALRDGAKFSDGTDVTTADVVNAFEKNMADATYGAFLEFIDTVSAKDDKTVSFTLKYPFDSLLKGRLSVVKVFPASLTEDDLKTKPIGSGPWVYDTINGDDGGSIEFVPNTNYNGKYAATADEMHWDILLDDTSRTTALQEATVQVMENVPDANAEQLMAAGASVDYIQGFNQPFFMFNTLKKPFDDKRVRQAFYYAVDVDKLISNAMAGHAAKVTSFLPESHENYHKASTVYTYDPEKAKSLLSEAGVTDLSFELMTNNNWVKNLAAGIKNDLDAIGVNCTINETKIDWASLAESADVLPYDVMLTPGDPTCFGNDPDLLMSWWYGDNVWTQGRSCWKKAGDGKFDELQTLMQQAREATGNEQQELWNKCFDLLAEEVPLYPLFHRELATGYQETQITGFEPIATTGLVFLGASVKA
ncbi:ABC transporter substrate-binding protein [Eggerthella lenta]|uniref:ABC transporter substrate-binding protein n=1 Tax=Eggerthella lenta TaxID=84112 RepID=UPI002163DA29|nr:ABC transporter substrate-binding protein [Eggerthella lenta]